MTRKVAAILATVFLAMTATGADDDGLKEKAQKLNRITGTTAMSNALRELIKDEEGTKKLIAVASRMAKDEKPRTLNYNACFILARAAHIKKDVDNALVFYKACAEEAGKLGSASKVIDVYEGLIDLYSGSKKYEEAIKACQEFLSLPTDDPDSPILQTKPFILERMIQATSKKGSHDEALKMTEELIRQDKDGWYFIRLKGEVLREADKLNEAADSYLESIERLKKNKRLDEAQRNNFINRMRLTLSDVYVDANQVDKGTEQLELLLKTDPDNPTFLNNLGYILADHDKRLDEAEKFIRKALEKDKELRKKADLSKEDDIETAIYLDSLGWVLFKKKDYEGAKKELLAAVKLPDGKHIEIYDHLGDVYLALGDKAEAAKWFKDALKLDENLTKKEKERKKKVEQKVKDLEAKKK